MPYTRPTTDIAREGLFNVIANNLDFSSLQTLDLFGGTGSITYELASRGATQCTIVEKDAQMADFIKASLEKLGLVKVKLVRMDVFKFIESVIETFDLIFAGPPYALHNIDELPRLVFAKPLLNEKGWFILEHTPRNNYEEHPKYRTSRKYGTTVFSIFVN